MANPLNSTAPYRCSHESTRSRSTEIDSTSDAMLRAAGELSSGSTGTGRDFCGYKSRVLNIRKSTKHQRWAGDWRWEKDDLRCAGRLGGEFPKVNLHFEDKFRRTGCVRGANFPDNFHSVERERHPSMPSITPNPRSKSTRGRLVQLTSVRFLSDLEQSGNSSVHVAPHFDPNHKIPEPNSPCAPGDRPLAAARKGKLRSDLLRTASCVRRSCGWRTSRA